MNKIAARLVAASIVFLWTGSSWANCIKITAKNTNPAALAYTEPGKGDVVNWAGSVDTSGSIGSAKGNVNIGNDSVATTGTFLPDGSLLASGIVNFTTEMGAIPYTPDTILFRCTPDEEGKLFEFYATNGDAVYAGRDKIGDYLGLDEVYQTAAKAIGIRVTNLNTGEYYSRYWKSRPLTDLDRDSQNYLLVKAKNFSNAKVELFKVLNNAGNNTGLITYSQPATYTAFRNSNTYGANLADGADSLNHWDGFYSYWPGAISLYQQITVNQINTCKLTQSTPLVRFPAISATQLMQGENFTQPIDISFVCQSPTASGVYKGFQSGIDPDQTAIGFVIPYENAAAAREEGLEYAPNRITHLVSNGYKSDPEATTGVGVRITSDGSRDTIDLFDNTNAPGGMDGPWYPVLYNASATGGNSTLRQYNARYYATLEHLPGKPITPGYFHASMQVVIKVL